MKQLSLAFCVLFPNQFLFRLQISQQTETDVENNKIGGQKMA